jgi:thiol-disulfide isomerase/thioredoxin
MGRVFFRFRWARALAAAMVVTLLGFASVSTARCQALAPAASTFDLDGHPVDPLKMSAGKVTVLVFVRTDCPVANRYAPTIQRLSAQYGGTAAFWLVYPSKAESAEQIRKHEEEYGYKLPALRDPQHALVKTAEIQVTPEVAVFDARRRLVYHGRIDDLYVDIAKTRSAPTTHDLADAIQAALVGKSLMAEAKPGVGCFISDLE